MACPRSPGSVWLRPFGLRMNLPYPRSCQRPSAVARTLRAVSLWRQLTLRVRELASSLGILVVKVYLS